MVDGFHVELATRELVELAGGPTRSRCKVQVQGLEAGAFGAPQEVGTRRASSVVAGGCSGGIVGGQWREEFVQVDPVVRRVGDEHGVLASGRVQLKLGTSGTSNVGLQRARRADAADQPTSFSSVWSRFSTWAVSSPLDSQPTRAKYSCIPQRAKSKPPQYTRWDGTQGLTTSARTAPSPRFIHTT